MDEFGGIPVSEDEFGGLLVGEEAPTQEVIRDVPRGTLEPTDLFPGIRKIGGEIVPGQLGDTHQDIIRREGIKAEDLDQRVFVTPWGDVIDREGAAQAVFPKVIPQFEPNRLHSTDLNALQTPGEFEKRLQAAAEEEGAKPLFKIPEPSDQFQKIAYGPTRAIYGEKFADTYKSINDTIVNAAKSVPEFLSTEEGMLSMLASLNPLGRAGVETYFTVDMAKNLWDQAKSGIKDWDSLTIPQKASRITQGAVTLGFLGLLSKAGIGTVKGAIKTPSTILYPTAKEAPPAERPGEAPLAAPTEGKAEVGEVVQAAPTEPAITTDKTVLPQKQVELRTPSDIAKELGIEAQESVGNFDRYLFKHKKNAEQLSVPKGSGPEVVKAQMEKALARWITPDEVLKASDAEIQSIPQGKELSDRIGSEMTEEQLKAAEPVIVEYLKKQASDKKLLDEGKIGVEEYAQRVMEARTKGKLLVDVFAGLNRPLPEVPVEAKAPDMGLPTTVAAPTPETIRAGPGAAVPKIRMTFQQFLRAPREGELLDALRTLPKRELSPEEAASRKAVEDAYSKLEKANLTWMIDHPEQGTRLSKAKQKLWDNYNKAWQERHRIDTEKRQEVQRYLYDKAVSSGIIENPEAKPAVAEPINLEVELGAGVSLKGVSDAVKASVEYLKSLRNEELKAPKMTDRRRAILNWSAKLQRSYGEAFSKQKDIIKAVPNQTRREGITNWIQANGDRSVLQDRYNATSDPKLKAGYKAALELTPDEIAVANSVKSDYANFAARGQAADVLGDLKDNYVTQTWDLGRGPGGLGTGRTLKEKFRFSKARTFESFFEGEQAGYTPKTKDIARLLPMYSHEMNSVIAAREMVAEMGGGVASDGRPLLAPKGIGIPVDSAEGGKATLVLPKVGKADISDYKVLPNQPALSGWKWVAKDDAGNPVFLKADLAIHPEAFAHLRSVLGRSAIREWFGTRTTSLSELPKMIVKGIDMANSETKRTMLGLLATFHQIQTGTHAVGHRVNPFFSIPKIDLVRNPVQMDAAKHGLMMLPDRASMDQFMEGFRTSGLISKIPGLGPIADYYSHYLFHEYIPGLKFKTYEAILRRNQHVYAKDLAAGRVTPSDIKVLSSEQANAAYGHLNYADLARNPTMQHIAQIGLLAPDFLEARGRFAGQAIKGLTGAKVGREQLLALATLAIAQAAGAYVVSRIVDGEWDKKRPFEFVKGNRRYTVRSVPEDLVNLVTKTRQFIHSRLSPLVGKGTLQYLTGVDYRGQKVKALETTKELAAQPIPLTIRGFTGLGKSTLSGMEQLAGSLGLRISRYSPSLDVFDLVKDFKKSSNDPKLQADIELQEKEVFSSVYDKLRTALRSGDIGEARKEYDKVKTVRTPKQIDNAMKPWTGGNLNPRTLQVSPRNPKPFTGSAKTEKIFLKGLTPDQRTMYDKAVKERLEFYNTFKQMLAQPGSKETDEFGGVPVE